MIRLKIFLKQYTWLIILLAVATGFVFPEAGMFFKPYLSELLMALMFFSCISINFSEILKGFKNPMKIVFILAVIHLFSTVLVFALKGFFSDEIFLGLILATVASSGVSAVFLTHLFEGDTPKSLVITSVSNLLIPLSMPVLVLLFAQVQIDVNPWEMMWKLFKLIIIPLVLAGIIRQTQFDEKLEDNGTYLSIGILFIIILGIISGVRDSVLANIELSLWLSALIAILCMLNFAIGFTVGKTKKEKISFSISAFYKNFALSTVIALSLFGPMVALPSLVYTIVNNLLLAPIQYFLTKK